MDALLAMMSRKHFVFYKVSFFQFIFIYPFQEMLQNLEHYGSSLYKMLVQYTLYVDWIRFIISALFKIYYRVLYLDLPGE